MPCCLRSVIKGSVSVERTVVDQSARGFGQGHGHGPVHHVVDELKVTHSFLETVYVFFLLKGGLPLIVA